MSYLGFKFLLDENVRIELYKFLKKQGVDVKLANKGLANGSLAKMSLKEKRVLVTNDKDFIDYTKSKIMAVVWLRVAQDDPQGLLRGFSLFLSKIKDIKIKGRVVILKKNEFEVVSLWKESSAGNC